MFGGSQTTSKSRKLFTGLTSFEVVMFNPTKEEIEANLGREYKLGVDYSVKDIQNRSVRPIEFWVKSVDGLIEPLPLRFLVGRDQDINQNGTIRFINSVGEFAQGKSASDITANEKMGWFTKHPFRPAIVGEYELYSFMQKLMRYSSRSEGANFMADAEANGMSAANIYEGDLKGLQKFFTWTKENKNKITLIAAIRKQEKLDGEQVRIYYNQSIINNPQYMYQNTTGEVNHRSVQALNDALARGSRVATMLFTVDFKEFKLDNPAESEAACVNAVPTDTAAPAEKADVATNAAAWLNM